MARDDRIELILEGMPEDEGRLKLSTFMSQLQRFGSTLTKLDRENNDGKSNNIFQIAELSYNSPLRIVLEPKAISPHLAATGHLVVERLRFVGEAIASDGDLSGMDAELLEDIKSLATPVGKTIKSARLVFNGSAVDLTPRVAHRLEIALAVQDECDGSLDGDLDQINVHEGANTFHIYPRVGPRRVTCHFPARLFDDAVAAVGRRIEVFGTLRYRSRSPFPHQIAVNDLDVINRDDNLPDWEELLGRAPDATGDKTSEAFVREIRDGWE